MDASGRLVSRETGILCWKFRDEKMSMKSRDPGYWGWAASAHPSCTELFVHMHIGEESLALCQTSRLATCRIVRSSRRCCVCCEEKYLGQEVHDTGDEMVSSQPHQWYGRRSVRKTRFPQLAVPIYCWPSHKDDGELRLPLSKLGTIRLACGRPTVCPP